MKIVIIGGTGLVGTKVGSRLRDAGHEVVVAAPQTGVNTITGEGLDEVLVGADVVIDVANSPSFEEHAVMEFFLTSGRNVLKAEAKAGIKHHVALSIVGTERLPDSAYFRAKLAQEGLIRRSGIPYSIVHATQFFEFLSGIAQSALQDDKILLAPVAFQPMASDDVADAVADVAKGAPLNGDLELGGPEKSTLTAFVQRYLKAAGDNRQVVEDPTATYWGGELNDKTLVPGANPRIGKVSFDAWFAAQPKKA